MSVFSISSGLLVRGDGGLLSRVLFFFMAEFSLGEKKSSMLRLFLIGTSYPVLSISRKHDTKRQENGITKFLSRYISL